MCLCDLVGGQQCVIYYNWLLLYSRRGCCLERDNGPRLSGTSGPMKRDAVPIKIILVWCLLNVLMVVVIGFIVCMSQGR